MSPNCKSALLFIILIGYVTRFLSYGLRAVIIMPLMRPGCHGGMDYFSDHFHA